MVNGSENCVNCCSVGIFEASTTAVMMPNTQGVITRRAVCLTTGISIVDVLKVDINESHVVG
jgi:hypothetical protein